MIRSDVETMPSAIPIFTPRCPECEAYKVRTSERYWACPNGHGGLEFAKDQKPAKIAREDNLFKQRLDAAGW